MRVALVSEHASPLARLGSEDAGGQNVHVAGLAEAMARRGAQVTVYTRRDSPGLPDRIPLSPGVSVRHVDAGPPRRIPKDAMFPCMTDFASELAGEWLLERPDVVHAHFWMSGYAAITAARGLGIPVIQTFHALGSVKRRHQGRADSSPAERQDVERMILATADHVIATCSDEVDELRRLDVLPQRVSVVPCGVDLELFSPEGPRERRRPGWSRLASVGRLVERKGVADAVAALAELPRTELVVAGHGEPEQRRLSDVARRLGVADRVAFRGRMGRAEVARLMRSSDAVVCVPWYEPFGIAPIEAMVCGIPVIGSAVGGLLDTVVDGVTGILVPPRDPLSVAWAARELLDDAGRRQAMGRAGALRARRHYSWGRVADLTVGVYGRVLAAAAAEEVMAR